MSDPSNPLQGLLEKIEIMEKFLDSITENDGYTDIILTTLREIRNSIASPNYGALVSNLLKQINFFSIFSGCFSKLLKYSLLGEVTLSPKMGSVVTVFFQCCANLSSLGEEYTCLFWLSTKDYVSDHLILISKKLRNRNGLAALLATIYNCCRSCENSSHSHLLELIKDRVFWCQLFLSLVESSPTASAHSPTPTTHTSLPISDPQSKTSSPASDSVLEWVHILAYLLLRRGYISQIFLLVKPLGNDGRSAFEVSPEASQSPIKECWSRRLSLEQLVFLCVARDLFEDPALSPLLTFLLTSNTPPPPPPPVISTSITTTITTTMTAMAAPPEEAPIPLSGDISEHPSLSPPPSPESTTTTSSSSRHSRSTPGGVAGDHHHLVGEAADVDLPQAVEDIWRFLVVTCDCASSIGERLLSSQAADDEDHTVGDKEVELEAGFRDDVSMEGLVLCMEVIGSGLTHADEKRGIAIRECLCSTGVMEVCREVLLRWGFQLPKQPSLSSQSGGNNGSNSVHDTRPASERYGGGHGYEGQGLSEKSARVSSESTDISTVTEQIPLNNSGAASGSTDSRASFKEELELRGTEESHESSDCFEISHRAVRASLRLLANLVYGCRSAQDSLRESKTLAAVLSNCGTNFNNPLAREWALLCVRNACIDNASNQKFIDDLRPQGVIQDEALRDKGISIDIDPSKGKFRFNKEENISH